MSRFLDDLGKAASERDARGLTRRLIPRAEGTLLDLAGNDYLGLHHHPQVVAGAIAAIEDFGTGAGASRLSGGTLSLHLELEEALARHFGADRAVVFSTGYQANIGAITALSDADTLIVSDEHNHASLIDGARLSRGQVVITAHHDVAAVKRHLRSRSRPRAMVMVESISSVLGDASPLADLVDLTARYDAVLLVDEAHAVGVTGARGAGLLEHLGLAGRDHVVVTTSLAMSLASQGGAVLGHGAVREHLTNTARPFIFDTGLAPASAGAALAALDVIQGDRTLTARVRAHISTIAEACGVATPAGASLSVAMPGPREALAAVDICAAHGLRIGCLRPPSTRDGSSRLRITAHADHSDADLAHAATVLSQVIRAG